MARKKQERVPEPAARNPDGPRRRRGRPIPLWQLGLLGVSVVLMLGGGVAWGYAKFVEKPTVSGRATGTPTDPSSGPSSVRPGSLVSDFGPGTPAGTTGGTTGGTGVAEAEPSTLDVFSPAVFRLGFSFFAAFAMAYALRQFVKVTLVVVGAVLIGLFALQYAGVISVDWSFVEGKFDSVAAFVKEQTATFTKFVSGYLPSATSAAAGAFVGFRKK